MKVFSECCQNCLLSKDRIVSPSRAKEIIETCKKEQSYFICHKASVSEDENGQQVMCKSFYDKFRYHSQLFRIAERLDYVRFVEQTDSEKFPTHAELNKKTIKNRTK